MRLRYLGVMISFSAGMALIGCRGTNDAKNLNTPMKNGINGRDVVDIPAQAYYDKSVDAISIGDSAREIHQAIIKRATAADPERMKRPGKNILCLSGGGSYGAFSAGILCGWTASGTRPEFDVVTGISTGSLIAPMAFLGVNYDEQMKKFYTQITTKDVFTMKRTIQGLLSESLADNAPLFRMIQSVMTEQVIMEIAEEHRKGRRLYVGTTEVEGKQFVIWDIGAIAANEGPSARCLICKILLGSAAIPTFFPSSKIPVTIDGNQYVERHADGGVTQGIFMQAPYIPPEQLKANTYPLAGAKVWSIVAGKLYTDPEVVKPDALSVAGSGASMLIAAQTRGDLQRMFTVALLSGMEYNLTAIPPEFAAPKSATDFSSGPMLSMFNEGYRMSVTGKAWRKEPPGLAPGEQILHRDSTNLNFVQRGPTVPLPPPTKK